MKLEVGMYCRYKNFQNKIKIGKICEIMPADDMIVYDYIILEHDGLLEHDIINASFDIIDILEVGDYVNGMEVTRISGTRYDKNDLHCYCEHNGNENWQQVMIPAENIKSIVTKEQFKEMSYKVGE